MGKYRELSATDYACIFVCGKAMILSYRYTQKGIRYYLRCPLRKVFSYNEISKELFDTLVEIKHTSKPQTL